MEKANYDFWKTIEDLSISQAAYLWCGYEMPPDETTTSIQQMPYDAFGEKNYYSRTVVRAKEKTLPQTVKFILFQLIQAIDSGSLKLKSAKDKHAFMYSNMPPSYLKSVYEIDPKAVDWFSEILTTKTHLKLYAESIGQKPIFLYPDKEEITHSTGNPKFEIIKPLIPGLEEIYNSIKEIGFSERGTILFDDKKKLWRKAALTKLSEIESKYPLIDSEFLSEELFEFNTEKQKRDFLGKLIKKILLSQGIEKPGGYVNIYKEYLEIVKDMS